MKEILTSKRKVQIRGLYSSEELERKKRDLKKRKNTSKLSNVTIPLNSPKISDSSMMTLKSSSSNQVNESSSRKSTKNDITASPREVFKNALSSKIKLKNLPYKQDNEHESSSRKSIASKNSQSRLAKDEDRLEIENTAFSREESRKVFRNAFRQEIQKIELNMLAKFNSLKDSKDKQIQEEKEKIINLTKSNDDLQKENDRINQSMENLKKLIVPMKIKLEENKKQKDKFENIEKGLLEEIGKLKTLNESQSQQITSFNGATGSDEEVFALREDLNAQLKKVEILEAEKNKIAKEMNAKDHSLKQVHGQCFTLKEEIYKLKKDQKLSLENRVEQINKIKNELAEIQKTSIHYKNICDKYKADNEASERIILEKEQEIKKLREAVEQSKIDLASSSKRLDQDQINSESKRRRIEESSCESEQQLPGAESRTGSSENL